ncbi:putative DNA helicase [Oscillochloris trichoides DG-6]|uniref:DNA helicase n=1 Tax=Oscillochloris trichoides DG-6 TaxID=765420 RepID=E1IB54_9CHLR|nr:DISARM system helicase DrmA [Oscillochloris trichoides]EFO81539.1 putative DNA helicase [Oscillochloris trichoides DG-6]
MTMNKPIASEIRDRLITELRRDLVGPHTPNEEISDRPSVQYLTGILYPAGKETEASEEDEHLGVGGDDAGDESENQVIFSQTMYPSAIGLSFAVDQNVSKLYVQVDYGIYKRSESSSGVTWKRQQITESIIIIVNKSSSVSLDHGARLEWSVQPYLHIITVTISLVNRNISPFGQQIDDDLCLFQPAIRVMAESGERPFSHRVPLGTIPDDPDLESYRLLYRDSYEFAVGHNCAVSWGDVVNENCGWLQTWIIPDYQLQMTTPNAMDGLEMSALADAPTPADITIRLQPLLDAYALWIDQQHAQISSLAPPLHPIAERHIVRCRQTLDRMRSGLRLLQSDQQIFEAFRFANRTMLLQRSYGTWAEEYRRIGSRRSSPTMAGTWRPFQIAFILLNLEGIAQPEVTDREIVDLLWFPTGGGKTEAYLGLTAFTIGLRRLRGEINGHRGDGGVTVIMRYTLRLLTTQQFQRAATLICACEYLRRRDTATWGTEPISIGLWVGAGATPNSIKGDDGAEEALKKLYSGKQLHEGNPVQMTSCPWCGEELGPRSYSIDTERERMIISCPRKECEFHSPKGRPDRSIPTLLIDEDIYHFCPTLLLATADKFARLPWKPQTMALFGKVERHCPKHGYLTSADEHPASHRTAKGEPPIPIRHCPPFLPPELIIQDELHLISGPLGTLTGLYETAIDVLCIRPGERGKAIRPKVIASTATIRRAHDQVRGLFARDVQLFPPSALNAQDSFFARSQPLDQQPGRSYVGVFAPGRSVKTALVRVYAILLQVGGELMADYGPDVADAYFTLVGYFNSLRELGGALRLVEDDIVQRMKLLSIQRKKKLREISAEDCELTSRIPSTRIPTILKQLELTGGTKGSLDVLLATNMISVGVDVPRLGLMVVNGQPKASAEYIQATSRVGRRLDAPGLVITVYNWSRPRDISHYERFLPYHEALYRHVEATSVTPFAPRARDRALHAVVIAMARLLKENWADNKSASRFDPDHPVAQRIWQQIQQRVDVVDPNNRSEVDEQIKLLIDWWVKMSDYHKSDLRYQPNPYQKSATTPVLIHPAEEERPGGSRPTLNSLREVEGQSQLFVRWEE